MTDYVRVPREPSDSALEVYENTLIVEGRKGPGAARKAWAALLRELGVITQEEPSIDGGILRPLADRGKSATP